MQQVVLSLKSIISPKHNEEVSSIIRVENMKELSKESFSYPMSVDNEFDDLIISDFMITAPYISKQANKLFNEIFDPTDNTQTFVDKLITLLIRIHDKEGYNFMETNQFIDQCIILYNQ